MLWAAAPALRAEGAVEMVADAAAFRAAVARAEPGDEIVLADGPWRDVDLVFDARGSTERPIVMRARTPGGAVLCGRSRLRIGGRHLVVEGLLFTDGHHDDAAISFRKDSRQAAEHCRVTQCAIVDYNPAEANGDNRWLSLYGRGNRVDHCYLAGKTTPGTTLVVWLDGEPNGHRIDHNHFGPRRPLGRNGGETIRVGDSATSMNVSRTIVEKNLFTRCDGEAEIISNKSCENVYRGNTFVECSGALVLRHGNRSIVEGNFFLGRGARGSGGVRIIGEDHRVVNNYFEGLAGDKARAAVSVMNGLVDSPLHGYFQVQRATVAFNTFVDCKRTLVLGLIDDDRPAPLPPVDCTIANNLARSASDPLVEVRTPPVGARWLGNLFDGSRLGIEPREGITLGDVRLARAGDGLWRPAEGSPALDSAVGGIDDVVEDIDGQVRSGRLDVGCDERTNGPVRRRPLTAADVGPAWRRNEK